MDGFGAFLLFFAVVAVGSSIAGPLMANAANKKERERKLSFLKEHPELAKEIWQSIDEQEVHHRNKMDAYHKSVGDGFDKMGASFQKQADRCRKGRSVAFKLGVAVAKKLANR